MMKKTLSVVTLLVAGVSQAAGFAFDTHSGRSTGMSFATSAVTNDSTAIAFNVADILAVKKLDIAVGDVTTLPTIAFTPEGGSKQTMDSIVVPPPHAFGVYRLNDQMAAGIGVYVPFAAGTQWKSDFPYRTSAYQSRIAAYYINPSFAYEPTHGLRFGVGLDVVRGTVSITRKINFVDTEGAVELGGGSWGVGYNAGLDLVILDKVLNFGAAFRSPVQMGFEGNSDFQDIPAGFQTTLVDQTVKSNVTLPGFVNLGLGFTPIDGLTIAADAHLTLWSTFQDFGIQFEDPSLNTTLAKNWKDSWSFHLGGEYAVTPAIAVRLGAEYDATPSPLDTMTPDLPDWNRYSASVGLGFNFEPIRADLGYQFVLLHKTTSTVPGFEGTYDGTANVVGLTLGYSMK